MTPTVTVVVPTHDRVGLLRSTLRSILAQRDIDLEVVVVDDGSDAAHAAEIATLATGPVRVLRNARPGGVGVARNAGAETARGRWLAFCDDDDLWTPTKLARQVAVAEASERAWAYTGAVKFADGPIVWQVMASPSPEEVQERLPTKNIIPAGASNVLVDRTTFLAAGGFDGQLAHLADWDLWLRLRGTGLPAAEPGIGVAYRMHAAAMSLDPRGILEDLATIDLRWRHTRDGAALDPGPTHLWIAMSWLRAGRRGQAALSYLRASRTRPVAGLRGVLRTCHPRPPRAPDADARLPNDVRRLLDDLAGDGSLPPVVR